MVFIRRVRTRSGATAVQIAEYRDGRQQIVRHVGSAHTEGELGVLVSRAEGLLDDPSQGVFDLDVEEARSAVPLRTTPRVELLPEAQPPAATVGPGRVTGIDSRLLFEVLSAVYADLGFDVVGDTAFCDLVIARIAEPTSMLDAGRVLSDLGRRPSGYRTMQRTLARAVADDYRGKIATACFTHAKCTVTSPSCSTT